jgi:ferredoxin--NADP+ reductase
MYRILDKKTLAPGIRMLVVEAPLVTRHFRAGQFLVVRASEHSERIPLTAFDVNSGAGTLTIVVQEVGKSTLELGSLGPGDTLLDVVGPLGTPTPAEKHGTVVSLAGGVGAAEVILDLELLKSAGNYLIGILGARNKELVILEDEISQRVDELIVCTDDGSYGLHGFVTDGLRQLIEKGRQIDQVMAVGPLPMMRAVAELTRPHSIPTVVSLNTIMLDGTGMCGSCRLTVGGEVKFCCVHGPAFDAHQVDFEELTRRQRRFLEEETISLERYKRMMGLGAAASE